LPGRTFPHSYIARIANALLYLVSILDSEGVGGTRVEDSTTAVIRGIAHIALKAVYIS